MKRPHPLLQGSLLATLLVACTGTEQLPEQPNVLIILCDDLGYGDVGCYGQSLIRTPELDRMAQQGMRFTQAYAGSPVSAPSRATLMTGQHTGHTQVRGNKEYWRDVPMVRYGDNEDFSRVGQHPYDSARIILPEIMKKQGYATALFGKWAGGYEGSSSTPDKRGIDEFFGYLCQYQAHLYYPNFLHRYSSAQSDSALIRITLEENIRHPQHGPGYAQRTQYSADLIHQAALQWLQQQDGKRPFFGMFTYTLPHAELVQPQDSLLQHYQEVFKDRDIDWTAWRGSRYNSTTAAHAQFAAMVGRLDTYVGQILALLEEKGLSGNTLVIFTSDNGPHLEGGGDPAFFNSNGPLRGEKRQTYEGGIRVPLIAWWPGTVPSGISNPHLLVFYDFMATLCELSGHTPIESDGISFLPTLTGAADQPIHEFLYWEFEETDQVAVRMGDWKMVAKAGKPELYNLAEDLAEENDLSAAYPHIVQQLVRIARSQHTHSNDFKVTLP